MFFKIILPNNEIHLLSGAPTTFTELYRMVLNKFQDQLPEFFSLRYKDSEEELVLMTGNDDFQTAVSSAEVEKLRNLRIVVKKEETNKYLSRKKNSELENKKVETPKKANKARFNDIPLTESLTDLPTKETEVSINHQEKIQQVASNLPPWGGLSGASESISNFCSPIDNALGDPKFLFNRQESLENETHAKQDLFTKEQMDIIAQLIEKSVNKNLMEKLESLMSEAIGGDLPNGSRYSLGNKKFAHMSPLMQCSVPYGIRLSTTKRCKELLNNECSSCCECKGVIENVRFSCLTCKNYDCCEKCENSVEHPHPLLKIKPNKTAENLEALDNIPPPIQLNRGMSQNFQTQKQMQEELLIHSSLIPNQSISKISPECQIPSVSKEQVQAQSIETQTQKEVKESQLHQEKDAKHTHQHNNLQSPKGELYKPLETCEVDNFRRYKVTVVKEPIYDVIRVKANRKYTVDYTIKNTGSEKWPNEVCLICTQGINKGHEHKIPSLAPGKEYNVLLDLIAPAECGRFLSQWKLHYCENEVFKSFGKVTYIEIEVSPSGKEHHQKSEDTFLWEDQKGGKEKKKEQKTEILGKDQELMKETKCSEQVLNQAKILNDMFPNDLKEKIEFVKEYPTAQNINDLVSIYLDRLSNSCKRRISGACGNVGNIQKTKTLWL